MERKSFLENFWLPYPSLGDVKSVLNFVECGRLLFDEGKVFIEREGKKKLIKGSVEDSCDVVSLHASQTFRIDGWSSLFLQGDLVAIDQTTHPCRVALLAPNKLADASEKGLLQSMPSKKMVDQWGRFKKEIACFFQTRGFCEVETPYLVTSPGMEDHLEAFQTEFQLNGRQKTLFLPTSPEFHLKKLVSFGWEKIFEIKTCFRNNEMTDLHQPEFTMIEWYRSYAGLNEIVEDLEQLLFFLKTKKIILKENVSVLRLSVADAIKVASGVQINPELSDKELARLLSEKEIYTDSKDTWSDLFHRLMLEKVEPYLESLNQPVVLYDFPPTEAALSRISSDGWAQRFELYWDGVEIANAFDELTDPEEQEARWIKANRFKKDNGCSEFPVDYELINSLKRGMPPTGGIALGLERLFMVGMGLKTINEIKCFPHSHQKYFC